VRFRVEKHVQVIFLATFSIPVSGPGDIGKVTFGVVHFGVDSQLRDSTEQGHVTLAGLASAAASVVFAHSVSVDSVSSALFAYALVALSPRMAGLVNIINWFSRRFGVKIEPLANTSIILQIGHTRWARVNVAVVKSRAASIGVKHSIEFVGVPDIVGI